DISNRLADGENSQSTIRIEQLIETGGKRGLRMNAASETLEAVKLAHQDTIRMLIIGFYSLFYNLHQDILNYELANEEVTRFRRILDIAEKRYSAGFLSLIDYTKLKLSAVELENNLTNFTNQLSNDSTYFGYIIGSSKPLRPVGMIEQMEFRPYTEEHLVDTAYKNRYDLLSLDRQIKAASQNLALAKAMRIPDVTVGAEWEKFAPSYYQGLGLGLSFPLPVFNRRQGEILRRGAEQQQLEAQMGKIKKQIITEIRQALNNYTTSYRVYDNYRMRKPEMDDLLQRTEKSFTLGGITVLELLDTQKVSHEFQIKYHQALAQSSLQRALINVYTGAIK
ncbi:MAG: TolC family protein, partial [Syntrophales bacterium]|nr:TolC family protein [Syntrophales bacterium]